MPDCWCGGGAGRRVITVVVAPGAAWTSVGATGRGGCASAGFGTTLNLASLLSRPALAGFDAASRGALAAVAARAASCWRCSGGSAW